mmetsp:Transcript_38294/g.87240  ORF Transcript_38294/g.87240 Transcript_38294/m.87240 type:complete len:281 (+) Transcript_38294:410-1252(+)
MATSTQKSPLRLSSTRAPDKSRLEAASAPSARSRLECSTLEDHSTLSASTTAPSPAPTTPPPSSAARFPASPWGICEQARASRSYGGWCIASCRSPYRRSACLRRRLRSRPSGRGIPGSSGSRWRFRGILGMGCAFWKGCPTVLRPIRPSSENASRGNTFRARRSFDIASRSTIPRTLLTSTSHRNTTLPGSPPPRARPQVGPECPEAGRPVPRRAARRSGSARRQWWIRRARLSLRRATGRQPGIAPTCGCMPRGSLWEGSSSSACSPRTSWDGGRPRL